MNRLFVLSFENEDNWESYKRHYFLTIEIKDYNVIIDEINYFKKPVKNNLRTFDNIWKIATDQGDNYTTGSLLD